LFIPETPPQCQLLKMQILAKKGPDNANLAGSAVRQKTGNGDFGFLRIVSIGLQFVIFSLQLTGSISSQAR